MSKKPNNSNTSTESQTSLMIKELGRAGISVTDEIEIPDPKITKHGQELNFCIGLVVAIRKRLKNFNNYCIICHVKHSCERISGRPVVCCESLCLFRYSDLRIAENLEECEVCPFLGCSSKDDIDNDTEAIKALYPQPEQQGGIELKKLVQMHKHKYLPDQQLAGFIGNMNSYGVYARKVENIIQADLVPRFERKWTELQAKYPDQKIEPKLAWHGTADVSIDGIRRKGLLVPGKGNAIGHLTDNGWWGKGIYVSPNPTYSMGYMRGGTRGLFLVSVLMGRSVELKQHERMDGKPVRDGFDSHIAQNGQEYILFDESQVLPCYLLDISRF